MVEAAILFPILLGVSLAVIEFGFIFMRDLTIKNYMSQIVQRIERGATDINPIVTAMQSDSLLQNHSLEVCAVSNATTCNGNNRNLTGAFGSSTILMVRRDFTPLTPVGKLFGFTFSGTLTRQEVITVGLKSPPNCTGSNKFLQWNNATQSYSCLDGGCTTVWGAIGDAESIASCPTNYPYLRSGNTLCEGGSPPLCNNNNTGYVHQAYANYSNNTFSGDCANKNGNASCGVAIAVCCKVKTVD